MGEANRGISCVPRGFGWISLFVVLTLALSSFPNEAFGKSNRSAKAAGHLKPVAHKPDEKRFIVTYKKGVSSKKLSHRNPASPIAHVKRTISSQEAAVELSGNVDDAKQKLLADPNIESVIPDTRARALVVPDDPCITECTVNTPEGSATSSQWFLDKIGSPKAWDITQGSPSVTVAVVDTGVSSTHPELVGKVTIGPNYSESGTAEDVFGHGTHVAGIIAALNNNATTIAGVGWNTSVLSIKVLDDSGYGYYSDIAAGVRYAADNGVKIINCSFGGGDNPTMKSAIEYAQSKGALVIAAAGNGDWGVDTPEYPGAYDNVLTVAASDSSDSLASFATRGSWVELAAPGVQILSAFPGGDYAVYDGSSMAAPMVSAAAALVTAKYPNLTANQIAARINESAKKIASTGNGVSYGRLDLLAALSGDRSFWKVTSAGKVSAVGEARSYGSASSLRAPIVSATRTRSGKGYWLASADGRVYAFGDAKYKGSMAGKRLNKPIVSIVASASGNGYWLLAADGGIFAFGDAPFRGSMGGRNVSKPFVSMATSRSGKGYWLIASDGRIFSFGDAKYHGASGSSVRLMQIVRSAGGKGYLTLAQDGRVRAFGDAKYLGKKLGIRAIGLATTESGSGYWILDSQGRAFAFGDARSLRGGSTSGLVAIMG